MTGPVLAISSLVKEYKALRPLRVQELTLQAGERVTLDGLDAQAAEMLVTLVTGASLPDSGDVRLFGQSTAAITDSAAWLASLDGVGMLSTRVVLLDVYTARQNIALSLTLDIDPVAADVHATTEALGVEVGLRAGELDQPVNALDAERQMRVRLARALALAPTLLLAEHPSATLPRETVDAFGRDLAAIAERRGMALLVVTADPPLAKGLGSRTLTLDPATGGWKSGGLWQRVAGVFSRS